MGKKIKPIQTATAGRVSKKNQLFRNNVNMKLFDQSLTAFIAQTSLYRAERTLNEIYFPAH
jgi:hypothetical protein